MHTPVLCEFVIKHFENIEGKKIIDCTLGEGGHTFEIAMRGAKVLAIDADNSQVERFVKNNAKNIADFKIKTVNSNYADVKIVAEKEGFIGCDGILFDLGLSMYQINFGEGFSYKAGHQPLHMVIDTMCKQAGTAGAADVLAYKSESELKEIFEKYGEIMRADVVANKIVNSRKNKRIEKVSDLTDALKGFSESEMSKVFQALRIFVNDETSKITNGLNGAWEILRNGGVMQIITFHSGEDRVVKLWAREKGIKEVAKVIGRQVSDKSFERSAVLRVFKK